MQRQASLAVALALLLSAGLSVVAYRSVIRPVRELVQAQHRLARGGAKATSGNEIEQLRAGVSMLERQTLDREAIGRIFLGRYLVTEILGSGGMGTVFKGWDPKLQRHVALKTVHVDEKKKPDTHAEQRSSLVSEAVTLARLNHPNIVAVYDVEDSHQVAFIAMQFVEGTNLDRLLGRVGSLSLAQAVPLAAAIAHGLAAAHGHGVVHRDVKPGNVLLGTDGSIKVTDFGIAGHVTSVVQDAVVFGTPGYMPPEVLRGAKFEPGGDLFALGVVLYECLVGMPPFGTGDPQETIMRTQTATPPPLRARNSAVPPELEAFTLGLLEKDPATRSPSSASAAGEQLEAMARANGWQWSAPSTLTGPQTDDWKSATEAVFVPFDRSPDD
jgi:serine/threonine-protein kinase